MKLEGIPVHPEKQDSFNLRLNLAATDQINLYVTLQFNEQQESLFAGRIKFGLTGGQLRLKLENAEIPLECRKLDGSVQLCFTDEKQQQRGSENQTEVEAASVESQPRGKANVGTKKTQERTGKFQCTSCQITTKGSEENPVWVFELETGKPILKGLLENVKLGTLKVMRKPCRVEVTFEVLPRDVYLTEVEGLLPKNISKKRRAVLERAIARCLVEQKFKPYLSRQELRYD
jgi:hypothetical protein